MFSHCIQRIDKCGTYVRTNLRASSFIPFSLFPSSVIYVATYILRGKKTCVQYKKKHDLPTHTCLLHFFFIIYTHTRMTYQLPKNSILCRHTLETTDCSSIVHIYVYNTRKTTTTISNNAHTKISDSRDYFCVCYTRQYSCAFVVVPCSNVLLTVL